MPLLPWSRRANNDSIHDIEGFAFLSLISFLNRSTHINTHQRLPTLTNTCHIYSFLSPCILILHKPLNAPSFAYHIHDHFLLVCIPNSCHPHTGLSAQMAIDNTCIAQEIKLLQGLFFDCLNVVVVYTKRLQCLQGASPSGVAPLCQSFCTSTAISISSAFHNASIPHP
jgi:hypothetical protein